MWSARKGIEEDKSMSTFFEADYCYTVEWKTGKLEFWMEYGSDKWTFFYAPYRLIPENDASWLSPYMEKRMAIL